MSFSLLCHCSCTGDQLEPDLLPDEEIIPVSQAPQPRDTGIISYYADLTIPLAGPALHTGHVFQWVAGNDINFHEATLSLHCNGICIELEDGGQRSTLAWSPFTLVQACRLNTPQADDTYSWLRLFKVSIFQHGVTHFFALRGDEADAERAHWVADISRSVRELTQSLIPPFALRVEPLPGTPWTNNRLLAGYMVLCDDQGVSVVYCELNAPLDSVAEFVIYEDESCDSRVLVLDLDKHTSISERVGVDCSCFCFHGYHLTTRSSAEKSLWLRAISNVKVKLRHLAPNPTPIELKHYRRSILKSALHLQSLPEASFDSPKRAILPRREQTDAQNPVSTSGGPGPTGDGSCSAAAQEAIASGTEVRSVWSRVVVDAEVPLEIPGRAMARRGARLEEKGDSALGPQDTALSMPSLKSHSIQAGADGAAGPPSQVPWRATPRCLPSIPKQPRDDDIWATDTVGCDDAAGPPQPLLKADVALR